MTGPDGSRSSAKPGDAISIQLDREVDLSRGDVLTDSYASLEIADSLETVLVWLDNEPGKIGRAYHLKLMSQWTGAHITAVHHLIDVETGGDIGASTLSMNDIALCNVSLGRPVVLDSFDRNPPLGRFILADRSTNHTVAMGLIRRKVPRATNVHSQTYTVDRAARERLNGHRGKVIWMTGLSGSGKSTIADFVARDLHSRGYRCYVLDGDNIRRGINSDLGFSDADRTENVRRVAELSRLLLSQRFRVARGAYRSRAHQRSAPGTSSPPFPSRK